MTATLTTSGTWTDINGAVAQAEAAAEGVGTTRLSWGRQCHRSGYRFDGVSNVPAPAPGGVFTLGTFTHHHFPTCGGLPGPFRALLRVSVALSPASASGADAMLGPFDLAFELRPRGPDQAAGDSELLVTVVGGERPSGLIIQGFRHDGAQVSLFSSRPGHATSVEILTCLAPPLPAARAAAPTAPSVAVVTGATAARAARAHDIVRRSACWALGLGLIPVPALDVVALVAVQIKMLQELSVLYQIGFAEERARHLVSSLVASLGGLSLAAVLARSLGKVLPGVGWLVGAFGASVFGGALTLAVGDLFTMHYEAGGTLLDFDPVRMRDHFRAEFDKAQREASSLHPGD